MNIRSQNGNRDRMRSPNKSYKSRSQHKNFASEKEIAVNPRQIIVDVLTAFDAHCSDPEQLIENALKQKNIDHRDRRFIFEVVYGVIRRRMTLDYVIKKYVTEESLLSESRLIRVLRIGIYQLIYMDRVPDHASVNETVKLAKSDRQIFRFASVVNAVMRKLINDNKIITLPDTQNDLPERLSIEYSHPYELIDRWLKNFGLTKTKKLLQYNNEKPPVFLRRKIRDMSRQQFEADVRELCDPGTGYMNLYYKLKKTLLPENIRMIQQGLCNVQAPSSGWAIALMNIQKNERLLDMCSAPGGKTALMAELTAEGGTVCAGDIKWTRLLLVVETMNRMHLENVYPLLFNGDYPPFTGHFDKVLLDAPCTGSGVFNHHPEARWIRTSSDVIRMADIQKNLLQSAAQMIGPDGIIVYSTCSLEPEENEMQIIDFLKRNSNFQLDPPPNVIPAVYTDNNNFLRITPFDHGMDGIFAARLRKCS